ncbi:MAG: sulfotransferase [Thermoplasmata archaeon]|mgnify:CR=1 FL=1|nr:MAG: sulfotransferase [Thermoplasmata archaeon]
MTRLKFNKEDYLDITKQPLAGTSLANWIKLLIENHFDIDWQFWPKAIYVTFMILALSPLRIYEKIKFEKEIRKTQTPLPIFIIGHFRSGTTFLHYLMGQDRNLAKVSTFETMSPWMFIEGEKFLKNFVKKRLPEKRPMDDLEMEADLPYEEEYAIGNLSPYSFYHGWYFARNIYHYYRKYVLFNGVSDSLKEKWKRTYTYLLKKIALKYKRNKVLLKSPVNTGRIRLLLEAFPNAKFIHICRNPYEVYLSTWRLYKAILPIFSFQHVEVEDIDRFILDFYKGIYRNYFTDKRLIPEGNLIEIRYEEFVRKPIETVKDIYERLGIGDFKKAEPSFRKYVKAHEGYKPHNYKGELNEEIKEKVYREWGFAFEKLGYSK